MTTFNREAMWAKLTRRDGLSYFEGKACLDEIDRLRRANEHLQSDAPFVTYRSLYEEAEAERDAAVARAERAEAALARARAR